MQIDEPTNFQVFMAEVNKTAKTESIGVYHQVPSVWLVGTLQD